MTIIHALPDCLIYIVLPLILAFRTFKDINVFHSKEIYSKIKFWVYVLTILSASMLFRIGVIGFYPIIMAVVFFVIALQDYKEIGRIEERIKQEMTPQQNVEKQKKNAGHGSQALKKKRTDFLFVLTVAVLSLLNFFGVFSFLS